MRKVVTKTNAVYQGSQQSLNNLKGVVVKEINEHEIIVRLNNGLVLPFAKSELIFK